MPEGDTLHTLARAIAPLLEGRRLARFELAADRTLDLAGVRVARVEARGKHLLFALDGDLVVRTHLGMHGTWHRYAPDERWKRPAHRASVVLATEDDVFVCFNAKESECVRGAPRALAHLGPDLAADTAPDGAAIVRRARALCAPDAPLVDVLLHQGVACGIGNVYKSELLFLHGLHPLRRLDATDDALLTAVYATARELLRNNLHGGPRVTRSVDDGAGDVWAYGRAGRPCLRCAQPLEQALMGRERRVTYWCARCQV